MVQTNEWIRSDNSSNILTDTLSKLSIGQVSEPFVLPEGLAIVQLQKTEEPKTLSLAEVHQQIEQRIRQQKINQLVNTESEQLADLTYTNPSSLQEAAKALKLPIQTSPWLSCQGLPGSQKQDLLADPKILAAAFSDEVLKQGNNSPLIDLQGGNYIVLRAIEHRPSKIQDLNAVSEKIRQSLQKEEAQKKAGLQAYEIQNALEKGESVATLANRYHLTWVEKTMYHGKIKLRPRKY